MNQGWEKSNFLDIEQLWKQKQQKAINQLPKPRFTQRDIIDKRIYIPSPGATKSKKIKLERTCSSPNLTSSGKKTLHFHPYQPKDTSIHKYPSVRSSLDDLSEAIAMTEHQQQAMISSQPLPDISQIEPNLTEDQSTSPPSSPITSAAKAIMMFVNSQPSFIHEPYSQ